MSEHRGRSSVVALLLTLLVTFLAACSGGAPTSGPNSNGASGAGEPMDVLRWAGPGPVVTVDATKAGDATSMNGIYLTSGQLTRFNADREPVLDLAESIEVSKDGLRATVTLLPDIKYSDGTPILAEDIKFSIERNRKGAGGAFVASMESVEVVDDRTAIIHLRHPDPDLLSWLAERGTQLHPKSLVESDPDYWNHPVSGGPYVIEEGWTPGGPTFRAVENPNYPKGPMMAKAIEIVSIPDVASRQLQLTSGQLDAALDLPLSSKDTFPEEVHISYAGVGGTNYLTSNQSQGGPLADAAVRQAMSLAIDREAISEKAFFGLQPPSTSPLYQCGDLCEPDILPGSGARDVEAAKQLMEEAGYADGFSVDLKVSNSRGGWQEAAVIVAENLADIGIDAQVTPVDEGQHFSSITDQNYELFFTGGSGHPQSTLAQMLVEGEFWVASTGWQPPAAAEEVMDRTAQTLDLEQRREAYTEAQELWAEAAHVISIVERVQLNGNRAPEGVFIPQIKNDQKVIVQTVEEAEQGVRAGDL